MTLSYRTHTQTIPFTTFSNYQNLYFFCQRKCLYCEDHFGYKGDLSAGDIWTVEMKSRPIKYTTVITRTQEAEGLLQAAVNAGALESSEIPVDDIFQGQRRTARCHYQVAARHRVGKLFGEKIPDTVHASVRLVDYLIAAIVLFNFKISRSTAGKRMIFALPRQLLRAYLYFFKALESL